MAQSFDAMMLEYWEDLCRATLKIVLIDAGLSNLLSSVDRFSYSDIKCDNKRTEVVEDMFAILNRHIIHVEKSSLSDALVIAKKYGYDIQLIEVYKEIQEQGGISEVFDARMYEAL